MKSSFDKEGFKFTVEFISWVFLLYVLVSFSSDLVFGNMDFGEAQASIISSEISAEGKVSLITLGFVGDIMLDRGVESAVSSHGGNDFKFIFKRVETELNNLDFLFGNLEGPVSDKGVEQGALYSFRMRPPAIEGLLYAGFDILSLSNNHTGDWGEIALKDTIGRLKTAGIAVVGAGSSAEEAYAPVIIDIKGVKTAYLSFTESAGIYKGESVALATDAKVKESVEWLKRSDQADFIVVHFHFGDEYQDKPNERQNKLSRLAVDSGADLVVGSHPHVTQTVEKYKDGIIVYSLGNFVFDQYFSDETMRGWLLKTHLKNGKISLVEFCDVSINLLFQPVIIACKSA